MVTIDTSEDIVRALREDPDLLDRVQRMIMTDEVLALPRQFAAMLETQTRILSELADTRQTQNRALNELADTRQTQNRILDEQAGIRQTQNRILSELDDTRQTQNRILDEQAGIRQTQNRILDELADTRQTQNRLLDEQAGIRQTQNRILDELDKTRQTQNELLETQNELLRRVGNLETRFGRLTHDFGNFRGNYAETVARKRAPSIAMDISDENNIAIDELSITALETEDILALAAEYGSEKLASIPRETRRGFYESDLIIQIAKLDGSLFYIAVEASYTCDARDTTRATTHSRLITQFTGREAWPAVVALRLDRNIKPVIDSGEVFWFQITEENTDPR